MNGSRIKTHTGKENPKARNIPELLAPAGSIEMLRAVIAQGADAVYMGGPKFGARAYAENPEGDDLLRAIDLAHLYGVKVHMTVNTLLTEREMDELTGYVAPLYREGVDAVLVQDLGVFRRLHSAFPDLPLHVSTQMSVTGPMGAKLLAEEGASRIVLARELSLPEIRRIKEEAGCEIETFVHGALCVCYSGRCLFSSMLGGRSGNRGRCAQPCRLPYALTENGRVLSSAEEPYLLSPKDLCGLDLLTEMIGAGIDSLKIEGRMKKPVYAAGVTAIYRKYLDQYAEYGRIRIDEEDRRTLHQLFDRDGFTDGYLRGDTEDMMAAGNRKLLAGGTPEKEMKKLEERFLIPLPQIPLSGNASFRAGERAVLTAGEVTVYSDGVIGEAKNRPVTKEEIEKQFRKTGGTPFSFDALTIGMDGDVFCPVGALNAMRRELIDKVRISLLSPYLRNEDMDPAAYPGKTDTACPPDAEGTAGNGGPEDRSGKKQITEVFVSSKEQLTAAGEMERGDILCAEWPLLLKESVPEFVLFCREHGKIPFAVLPEIVRCPAEGYGPLIRTLEKMDDQGIRGFYARDTEGLAILFGAGLREETYADTSLYSMNRTARAFIRRYAGGGDTVPYELREQEIGDRGLGGSTLVVYGRIPLMVTAQRIGREGEMLRDRKGVSFPLRPLSDIWYNTGSVTRIGNSVPLYLADLPFAKTAARVRFAFTDENADAVRRILRGERPAAITRGHFRRGVQ